MSKAITTEEAIKETVLFHGYLAALNTFNHLLDPSTSKTCMCEPCSGQVNHHFMSKDKKYETMKLINASTQLMVNHKTIIFGYGKCSYTWDELEDPEMLLGNYVQVLTDVYSAVNGDDDE